jgi:hypothetical protein
MQRVTLQHRGLGWFNASAGYIVCGASQID